MRREVNSNEEWQERRAPLSHGLLMAACLGVFTMLIGATYGGFAGTSQFDVPWGWIFLAALLAFLSVLLMAPPSYVEGTTAGHLRLRIGCKTAAIPRQNMRVVCPLAWSARLEPVVLLVRITGVPRVWMALLVLGSEMPMDDLS